MLTVKHVSENGDELVIECMRVLTIYPKYDPVLGKPAPKAKQPEEVSVIETNGRKEVFTSGTVYVMNDTGATVSQWMIMKKLPVFNINNNSHNIDDPSTWIN